MISVVFPNLNDSVTCRDAARRPIQSSSRALTSPCKHRYFPPKRPGLAVFLPTEVMW